jgi:hypothetical protein
MGLDELWEFTDGVPLTEEAQFWLEGLKRAAEGNAESGEGQPIESRGERERGIDAPGQIGFCEQWMRFDALDRGRADEICVLWDVKNEYPVYYDFMENVSQSGRRPYEVLRICPVRGRWYGVGFYELLSDLHPFIDRQINRIDARNGTGGRLTYMKKGTFVEERLGIPISLNSNRIYTVEEGVQGRIDGERFGHVAIPQMDDHIWQLLNNAKQTAQLMMGTLASGDADNSHLPSNRTATGQKILQNESELMSSDIKHDMVRGTINSLRQAMQVVFHELDEEEANLILGDGNGTKLKQWLDENKIENLLNHVRLLLTKTRSKEQLDANTQLIGILERWMQLVTNPMTAAFAEAWKPVYKAMIQSLDFANADQLLIMPGQAQPMMLPAPGAPVAALPAQAGQPAPPPDGQLIPA